MIAAGRCKNRRWEKEIISVHPEVLALAVEAFQVFPAMPHAELRMFCQDPFLGAQRCSSASVSPEIGLIGMHTTEDWSISAAGTMIERATRDVTSQSVPQRMPITSEITMTELSDPEETVAGITQWMNQNEVDGLSSGERLVGGTITGIPEDFVTLSGLAKARRLSNETPQTITFNQREAAS